MSLVAEFALTVTGLSCHIMSMNSGLCSVNCRMQALCVCCNRAQRNCSSCGLCGLFYITDLFPPRDRYSSGINMIAHIFCLRSTIYVLMTGCCRVICYGWIMISCSKMFEYAVRGLTVSKETPFLTDSHVISS